MALDQSALLGVLHVLKTAKVDDRIRRAAETVYQALIEAELTAMTGAFPHQRTEALTASTNPLHPAIVATARISSPGLVPGKRAAIARLEAGKNEESDNDA